MTLEWLFEKFRDLGDTTAIVWQGPVGQLRRARRRRWRSVLGTLEADGVPECAVVALEADFQPEAVAALLALIERAAVIVPLTSTVEASKPRFRDDRRGRVGRRGRRARRALPGPPARRRQHPLLTGLDGAGPSRAWCCSRRARRASQGRAARLRAAAREVPDAPPGPPHHGVPALRPHRRHQHAAAHAVERRHAGRAADRAPEAVCRAIEGHRVELLPTSPTFLNLLLVSGAHQRYDLSSLQLVTYGTEPMSEGTLRRVHEALPDVHAAADLRPVRAGHPALEVEVVGLAVGEDRRRGLRDPGRRRPARDQGPLGHARLPERRRAPSPTTAGSRPATASRSTASTTASSGGSPRSSTSAARRSTRPRSRTPCWQMAGVHDAVVFGEPHDLLGRIVVARVRLAEEEDPAAFRSRMRTALADDAAALQDPPEGAPHHRRPPRRALQAHASVAARQRRAAGPALGA